MSVQYLMQAIRRPKRAIKALYFRLLGVGYVKRRITNGPIKGLWFISGKRVFYSKWFWSGTYEKNTCYFIQNILPEDAICYNIGANIGYHSLIMAKKAYRGLVYAFEPIPEVCDILSSNAKSNDINNIIVVPKVVSNENGTLTLLRNMDIDQAALINQTFPAKNNNKINFLRDTIHCTAITIDDFVALGNQPPSFLKIDVEGAEVYVLTGAKKTLKKYKPMILCETHGYDKATEVYEILSGLGYEMFCVKENVMPIDRIHVPKDMHDGHIFACLKKG